VNVGGKLTENKESKMMQVFSSW